MLLNLPAPYPDELLLSVLARQCKYLGLSRKLTASNYIFGKRAMYSADLMKKLDSISERTRHIWGLSAKDIAEQQTLYPYYTRYLPEERSIRTLELMCRNINYAISVKTFLGIGSRIKIPSYLKYCKFCCDSDMDRYGETYWRRIHQPLGVYVCPEHKETLLEVKHEECQIDGQRTFSDATSVIYDGEYQINKYKVSNCSLRIAIQLAEKCREILLGPSKQWPMSDINILYKEAALERGYGKRLALIDYDRLSNDLIEFYTKDFLEIMNKVNARIASASVNSIFYSTSYKIIHPIQHAMMQIFLENKKVSKAMKRSIGRGPWKCPNPYEAHDEQYPITKVYLTSSSKHNILAHVACTCGFKFTFTTVSDADSKFPIIHEVSEYGRTWCKEAIRLKQAGMKRSEIARRLGINVRTVIEWLNNKEALENIQSPTKFSDIEIVNMRNKWMRLLDQTPKHSRYQAHKANRNLYYLLYKYDRSWFLSTPRKRLPIKNCTVNWEERDKSWSQLLRITAEQCRESNKLERISKLLLVKRAKLPEKFAYRSEKLPLCQRVFQEYVESWDVFLERRLRSMAAQIRDKGDRITFSSLLRITCLKDRLNPHLTKILREVAQTILTDVLSVRGNSKVFSNCYNVNASAK